MRTALASFPRSGNTWLRIMIERASGEASGSIYDDRVFPRTRSGVVIKTHDLDSSEYERAIHLIRHPIDAVRSFFHWKLSIAGQEVDWDEHFQSEVRQWRVHTQHWLNAECERIDLRYEDLVAHPEPSLERIMSWLGVEIDSSEAHEIVQTVTVENLRRAAPKLGREFFRDPSQRDLDPEPTAVQLRQARQQLSDLLDLYEYEIESS